MHKERMYPPRFQIHVYAAQCVRIHVCFEGTAENIETMLLFKPTNSGMMVNEVSYL